MKTVVRSIALFTCCFAISSAVLASETESMEGYSLGSTVKPFTLKDIDGKEHSLGDVLGKKIIVLDFLNCHCPVSHSYEGRRTAMLKKYAGKDVAYFAIDSNSVNDEATIKEYMKKEKLNYTVLKDWKNVVADEFNAAVSPHVFIIGKDETIHYIGPYDDNMKAEKVQTHYVDDAITALLAGKEVATPQVKPFGCGLVRAY